MHTRAHTHTRLLIAEFEQEEAQLQTGTHFAEDDLDSHLDIYALALSTHLLIHHSLLP